jgi:vacuolar-type H+-ATPase subunit H
MALEIINAIRGTEDEAQKIKLDAQEAAKAMTKAAAENGEKLVADAEKSAREQAAKLLQNANEEAANIAKSSEAAETDEREKMYSLSKKNMADAARFIIEE